MKLQSIIYTLLLSVFSVYQTYGKQFIVTSTNTLANAIASANTNPGPDEIIFDKSITLIRTSSPFIITDDLTINGDFNGDGKPDVTISSYAAVGGAEPRIEATVILYSYAFTISGKNNTIKNLHFAII